MSFHCSFRRSRGIVSQWLTVAAFLAIAVLASPSLAQSIYTSGHADVGVGYDTVNDQFTPHWHAGIGAVVNGSPLLIDTEYEPVDLIARTSATRTTPSGGGGLSSVLGVPDGTTVYVLGSATYQPNLGWGAEELNPSDWIGGITVTFNPGLSTLPSSAEFALYTTNGLGTSVVDRVFSSFNGSATDASNTFLIVPGDHGHSQWALTTLGDYDLNFTWSGTHAVDGAISTSATFTIQAVPEPSTIAILGVAGCAGLVAVVRRRRHGNLAAS